MNVSVIKAGLRWTTMNSPHVVNDTVPASIHTHRLLSAFHYSQVSAKKIRKKWSHVCCSDSLIDFTEHLRVLLQSQSLTVDVFITSRLIGFFRNDDSAATVKRETPAVTMTWWRWCHSHRNAELAAVELVISSFRGWCLFMGEFATFSGSTAGFLVACLAAKCELSVLTVLHYWLLSQPCLQSVNFSVCNVFQTLLKLMKWYHFISPMC